MTTNFTIDKMSVTRVHRIALLISVIMLYLLIIMGGIVCVTGSSKACPDWPGCYGQLIPPLQVNSIIEYIHRFIAALTTFLIISSVVIGWIKVRSIRLIIWPPLIAIPFLIAVIVFGALAVLKGLPSWLAVLDLGSALIVLGLMLVSTVVAFFHRAYPALPIRLSYRNFFALLTLLGLGTVYGVLISSILVAGNGSPTRCVSFPLWIWNPNDLNGWPQEARWLAAGLATFLMITIVLKARSAQQRNPTRYTSAILAGVLFLVEMIIGALILAIGYSIFLMILYVAVAVTLWVALVILSVLTGLLTIE